jgi:AcrR family transcriptional regulator
MSTMHAVIVHVDRSSREAVVDAAAELLDEGGPAAVTFRAVGERVGLSHNAAFKLFRDKESLLAAVATAELRRQAAPPRRQRGVADPIEDLRRRLYGYVRWALRYPARFQLTFGRWNHAHLELGEAASSARKGLVDAVCAAQESGAIQAGEAERMASLLLSATHGAASLALNGHLSRKGKGKADPDDIVDDLLALVDQRK